MSPAAMAVDLGASPASVDELGVPRLLRGTDQGPAIPGATATASAVGHLARLAPVWGVAGDALPTLDGIGEVALPGGTIVRVQQKIAGLPIEPSAGGELRVMVRKDGTMVATSGQMFSAAMPRGATTFASGLETDAGAVALAVRALYKGKDFAAGTLATKSVTGNGTHLLGGQSGSISVSLSRATKAWWPEAKQLTQAWIVEMYSSDVSSTDGDAYRTVIAADGRVLSQTNLKADFAFKYRVFAETTGEFHPFDGPIVDSTPNPVGVPSQIFFPDTPYPAFVPPNLVTVDGTNHPAGRTAPDPWMRQGSTQTIGNNVEAYTDLNAPDGLTAGDFRATITANATFDRIYDFNQSALGSQAQQMAGITSLFYILNWMHDFWYDGGFTEAAGNGQNSNLGRGGADSDAMLGEAQDNALGGSRNNANMATPADGFPGVMQVFVWDNKDKERFAKVDGRTILTNTASFVPNTFDITQEIVLANDGVTDPPPTDTTPGGSVTDACSPLPADVAGKIVLVDRGTCSFKFKARTVQTAGGVGMLLVANAPGIAPPGLGNDNTIPTVITIPVLSISITEGATLKAAIAAGTTTVQMKRLPDIDLEGTLDASVLAHEFGHFLHHRLSNCNTALCGAMSEGWGDFSSLLVIARAEDRDNNKLDAAYPTGIYSTHGFFNDPAYFGIRRAPYSTDMTINGFTYAHFTQGAALPTTFPINGGNPATNNEVHSAGEVWANTMWEGYVALQKSGATRGKTFDQVRLTMRQYIVGGLLLAPTDNTPTEMRDAILTVAYAADVADHDALATAYAKRGLGTCAVSPARTSTTFVGIQEKFALAGRLDPGVVSLATKTSCDTDSVLDAGETGTVKVHLANGGPIALNGVAVTLTSTTEGIHITTPTASVGSLTAYSGTDVTFEVSLAPGITDVVAGKFTATLSATNDCVPERAVAIEVPLNSDDKPASSATESFNALGTVWTATTTPLLWAHTRQSAFEGSIHGTDDGSHASDGSFTSPLLAAGTDPVTISFKHKFSFEGSVTNAFDGGVIEFATSNDLNVWKDIATITATNPYNSTLVAGGTNVLAGRPAFGGRSTTFNAGTLEAVTLNLGTALSGKMFKIRFRVGSDANTGAPGWDIDDVAFTGITGTPFPTLVPDEGTCEVAVDAAVPPADARPDAFVAPDAAGNPDTGDDGGGCCQTGGGLGAGNAAAALLVLGTLLRRRRR